MNSSGAAQKEEAVAAYRDWIKVDPQNAKAYVSLGNVLGKMNKNEEAVTAYERAIELDPQNAAGQNQLGSVLREAKQFEAAKVAYERAIRSQKSAYHFNLGLLLKDMGKNEKARL